MGSFFSKAAKVVGGVACVVLGACTAGAGFALAPLLGGSIAAGGVYLCERGGMRPRGRVPVGQFSIQLGSDSRNDELARQRREREIREENNIVRMNAEAKRVDAVQSALYDFHESSAIRDAVGRHIENVDRHLQFQEGKDALDSLLLNGDGGGRNPSSSSSQATGTQIASNLFARLDKDQLDMQLERQFENLWNPNVTTTTVRNAAMFDNDYDPLPSIQPLGITLDGGMPAALPLALPIVTFNNDSDPLPSIQPVGITLYGGIPAALPYAVPIVTSTFMLLWQMARQRELDRQKKGGRGRKDGKEIPSTSNQVCLLPPENNPGGKGRCPDDKERVDFKEIKKQAGLPWMNGPYTFYKVGNTWWTRSLSDHGGPHWKKFMKVGGKVKKVGVYDLNGCEMTRHLGQEMEFKIKDMHR